MIGFENIDSLKCSNKETCFSVSQRYLHSEISFLGSTRPKNLAQKYESNFTSITLPKFSDSGIDLLNEERVRLIEKRNKLLDCYSLSLLPNEIRELNRIDEQLDNIESDIASLQKTRCHEEISNLEKFIRDNEKRINKYTSELNSI